MFRHPGERFLSKKSAKAIRIFIAARTYNLLLAMLMFGLIWPNPRAFAPDDTFPPSNTPGIDGPGEEDGIARGEEGLPAFVEEVGRAAATGSTSARLHLTDAAQNVYRSLTQVVVDLRTQREDSLALLNLDIPNQPVDDALLERALKVTMIPGGIQLEVDGYRYGQRIYYDHGRTAQPSSVDRDREYIYIHWNTGEVEAIKMALLSKEFTRSFIPVYPIGNIGTFTTKPGVRIHKIRVNRQRFVPNDTSRAGQLSTLTLNPDQLQRIERKAGPADVERLRGNLERIRPIPWCKDLAKTEDGSEREFAAQDLSLIGMEGDQEVVHGVVPRPYVDAMVNINGQPLEAMTVLTNPDAMAAIREMRELGDEAIKEIADVLGDDANIVALVRGGLAPAVRALDRSALRGQLRNAGASLLVAYTARENGVRFRDTWKFSESQTDFEKMKSAVDAAEARIAKAKATPRVKRFFNGVRAIAGAMLYPARALVRVATVLACSEKARKWIAVGAIALGADYMLNHGNGVTLAVDTVAQSATWVAKKMPVLADADYRLAMLNSLMWQTSVMAIVIAAAMLAKPFMQGSVSYIIFRQSIQWFAKIFQFPPARMFTALIRPDRWIESVAMVAAQLGRAGVAMTSPVADRVGLGRAWDRLGDWFASFEWPTNPMHRAGREGYLRYPSLLPGRRERSVTKLEEEISDDTRKQMLCYLVALGTTAYNEGVMPGRLHLMLRNEPDNVAAAQDMTLLLLDFLATFPPEEIAAALKGVDPQIMEDLLVQMRGKVAELRQQKETEGVRKEWGRWGRRVMAQRITQRMFNMGEPLYEQLVNPQPSELGVAVMATSSLVDINFTNATTLVVGEYADPLNPGHLAAQSGAFMGTHHEVRTSLFEQYIVHGGPGAAGWYLQFLAGMLKSYQEGSPSVLIDQPVASRVRPLGSELWAYVLHLLNIRKHNHLETFVKLNFRRRVQMARATALVGILPRLLTGGQAFGQAVAGQLFFQFMTPFTWHYPWAPHANAMDGLDGDATAQKDLVETLLVKFQQALRTGDEVAAMDCVSQSLQMYNNSPVPLTRKEKKMLIQGKTESRMDYARRICGYLSTMPPTFTAVNGRVREGSTLLVAFATTYLCLFLLATSFRTFEWLKMDLTDWNVFGMFPNDGVLGAVVKSIALLYGAWVGARTFNVGVDLVRTATSRPTSERGERAREYLKSSSKALGDLTAASWWLPPIAKVGHVGVRRSILLLEWIAYYLRKIRSTGADEAQSLADGLREADTQVHPRTPTPLETAQVALANAKQEPYYPDSPPDVSRQLKVDAVCAVTLLGEIERALGRRATPAVVVPATVGGGP